MPKPKCKARLHCNREKVTVTDHEVVAEPKGNDTFNAEKQVESSWDDESLYGPDAYQGNLYPVFTDEVRNTHLCSGVTEPEQEYNVRQ